jgi:hypothetical protein
LGVGTSDQTCCELEGRLGFVESVGFEEELALQEVGESKMERVLGLLEQCDCCPDVGERACVLPGH